MPHRFAEHVRKRYKPQDVPAFIPRSRQPFTPESWAALVFPGHALSRGKLPLVLHGMLATMLHSIEPAAYKRRTVQAYGRFFNFVVGAGLFTPAQRGDTVVFHRTPEAENDAYLKQLFTPKPVGRPRGQTLKPWSPTQEGFWGLHAPQERGKEKRFARKKTRPPSTAEVLRLVRNTHAPDVFRALDNLRGKQEGTLHAFHQRVVGVRVLRALERLDFLEIGVDAVGAYIKLLPWARSRDSAAIWNAIGEAVRK